MDGHLIPGLVPDTTLPGLIDADTSQSLYSRRGFDGSDYELVFSDEFNRPGRTFWPGDDPVRLSFTQADHITDRKTFQFWEAGALAAPISGLCC